MARTDQQRYDQALAHIKTVNLDLGNEVNTKIGTDAVDVGKALSLGGAGYSRSGTADQHTAVRALLLCQIAYFRLLVVSVCLACLLGCRRPGSPAPPEQGKKME